eukprot:13124270-Heterocapsa_arctica.AAC.1
MHRSTASPFPRPLHGDGRSPSPGTPLSLTTHASPLAQRPRPRRQGSPATRQRSGTCPCRHSTISAADSGCLN